ncbi:MAG: dephospho-CoA kinase [Deltaproteobacteria bacterium]|nr:dephospho-CoA kinase [Deltaproteobacteria bacterium]
MILGITGGIASGKSSVAGMLEEMGLPVIDFDIIARQVVKSGQPAWRDIVSCFGKNVLTDNKEIDRKKMSGIIFDDVKKREKLEEITHPRIIDQFIKEITDIAQNKTRSIIQAVIPLLFEAGLEGLVHKILVVYIPREKQIERLMKRDGIEMDKALKIINAQLPIDHKANLADFVIDNRNPPRETMKMVRVLYKELQAAHRNLIK